MNEIEESYYFEQKVYLPRKGNLFHNFGWMFIADEVDERLNVHGMQLADKAKVCMPLPFLGKYGLNYKILNRLGFQLDTIKTGLDFKSFIKDDFVIYHMGEGDFTFIENGYEINVSTIDLLQNLWYLKKNQELDISVFVKINA